MPAFFDRIYKQMAVPVLWRYNASEDVVFTDIDGVETTFEAIVGNEEIRDDEDVDGIRRRRERYFVIIKDADHPRGGINAAQLRGTITWADQVWAIDDVESESETLIRVRTLRLGRKETTRTEYRKRTT